MEDLGNRIKNITTELKEYVETKLELKFLNIGDRITYLIGQSIQSLAGYAVLGVGLVFGMAALAIYLGELLDERWAGYAIVGAPFLIGGLILIFSKPRFITHRIQNQIFSELIAAFEEKDEKPKQISSHSDQKKKEKHHHG
jgi:hypothetical protein